MGNETLGLRYRDIFNISDKPIHILGCGAVGSNAALALVRMGGNRFILYDMDEVSDENIGVSAYLPEHIKKTKVEALADMLKTIEPDIEVESRHGEFTVAGFKPRGDDHVLVSFDSMETRMEVAKAVCNFSVSLFVDSRMGAETLQMYSFENPTLEQYKAYWYPDKDADEEPCTRKATFYCAVVAGAYAASMVRKSIMNQPIAESLILDLMTFASTPYYRRDGDEDK